MIKVSQEVEPEVDAEQTNGKPITPTKAQILTIVRDEYGDDIALLHANSVKLGNAMKDAQVHRNEIESLVGNDLIEHQEFHTKLSSLGQSVSDVSSALGLHKVGHNGGIFGIPSIPTMLMIGGIAFLALRRKR